MDRLMMNDIANIQDIAEYVHNLPDEEYYDFMSRLAKLSECGGGIDDFTNWLNAVLHEIRTMLRERHENDWTI